MKKILKSVSFLIIAVYLPQVCFANQAVAAYQNTQGTSLQENQNLSTGQESLDGRADQLSQELARNKELLEIWKDHVRTVTKERDDAYKQIDDLKNGMGLEPAPDEGTISDLKAQISRLTADLNAANAALRPKPMDASSKLKISELQAENEKLKLSLKGFSETQNDKEVIIREKQQALQRIEDLEKETSNLRAENEKLKIRPTTLVAAQDPAQEAKIQAMQDAYDGLEVNFKDQQDRIRKLQAEKLDDKTKIQELKTQILKLQSGSEDKTSAQDLELQEAKAALETLRIEKDKALARAAALDSQVKTLEASDQKAQSVSEDLSKLSAEKDQLAKNYATLEANYQTQQETLKSFSSEIESLKKQNETLAAGADGLQAEKDRSASLKSALDKALADNAAIQKSYQNLQTNYEAQTEKLKALSAEKESLNGQIQLLQTKVGTLEADSRQMAATKQQLGAALTEKQALEKDNADLDNQNQILNAKIQSLKSDMDQLRVENQKAETFKADLAKVIADKENLQKSYAALQANSAAQDQKFKEYSAKLGELDRTNLQLKTESKRISEENQGLQENLKANLSDIKNLRANFESYLESLEQSFGERQKEETPAASS